MNLQLPGLLHHYDMVTPGKIIFGCGRRKELGKQARALGRRAFIVQGSRALERIGIYETLAEELRREQVEPFFLGGFISREPTVSDVDNATRLLHDEQAGPGDLVVAVGGGAALDLGKAVAAMAMQPADVTVQDYLEGIGKNFTLQNPALPVLALPTTGGTGSEATKNAVITSEDPPAKKSLRSEFMVPRVALVDPELSVSLPPQWTAWTGLDAITQLLESYISRRAQPLPRALVPTALRDALAALPVAVRDGGNLAARSAMAHAALVSGIALANSGLGLAHGVAAALGVHHGVPHGLACAVMLPVALRVNLTVAARPLAELAEVALGKSWPNDEDAARALTDVIRQLLADLAIPQGLRDLGVIRAAVPALVSASRGNSMNGNPRELADDELARVLDDAW